MSPNDYKIRLEILNDLYKFYTEITVNDGINVDYIAEKYGIDKKYFWNKHILYLEGAKHIKIIDNIGRKVAIDKNGISLIKPNDKFYKSQTTKNFFISHWQWIVTTIFVIAGLCIACLQLLKTK